MEVPRAGTWRPSEAQSAVASGRAGVLWAGQSQRGAGGGKGAGAGVERRLAAAVAWVAVETANATAVATGAVVQELAAAARRGRRHTLAGGWLLTRTRVSTDHRRVFGEGGRGDGGGGDDCGDEGDGGLWRRGGCSGWRGRRTQKGQHRSPHDDTITAVGRDACPRGGGGEPARLNATTPPHPFRLQGGCPRSPRPSRRIDPASFVQTRHSASGGMHAALNKGRKRGTGGSR